MTSRGAAGRAELTAGEFERALRKRLPLDGLGYPDPYDLWSTPIGVHVRRRFYEGSLPGKIGAAGIAVADWIAPTGARRAVSSRVQEHPITLAQSILILLSFGELDAKSAEIDAVVNRLLAMASPRSDDTQPWCWGLGFDWMSKNGLYARTVPFVTHTPYVMEALLALAGARPEDTRFMEVFRGTIGFLNSLRPMFDAGDRLALSYAPVEEPRIVVNANSYAAYAFAMHAIHGSPDGRDDARERATRITTWVLASQRKDGLWRYYADDEPGNFIDAFHTAFVLKNLSRVARLVPELETKIMDAVRGGFDGLKTRFLDEKRGLVRRFYERDFRDPYQWDLYDQAEYLGVLVDLKRFDEASALVAAARRQFTDAHGRWYARVDVFGRRWGRDFLRWGIVPFWYHERRLQLAVEGV